MAFRYHAVRDRDHLSQAFGVDAVPGARTVDIGDQGMFVRRPRADTARTGLVPRLEAATGRWGLIPLFSPDGQDRYTHEAASESASGERNFHQPWKRSHRCIVVARAVFESGSDGTMVRIARADGLPFCMAGLWNGWRSPEGACVESFALLTIPSGAEGLMQELPGERPQRRPVILPDAWVEEWFHAPVEETAAFLRPYPLQGLMAETLVALPAEA